MTMLDTVDVVDDDAVVVDVVVVDVVVVVVVVVAAVRRLFESLVNYCALALDLPKF